MNWNQKIEIRQSDDWQALYIDGKKVMENHSIDIFEIMKALNIKYTLTKTEDFPDKLT